MKNFNIKNVDPWNVATWFLLIVGLWLTLKKLLPFIAKQSGIYDKISGLKDDVKDAAIQAQIQQNPGAYQQPGGVVVTVASAQEDAQSIYYAFRLFAPWWDANSWYEDEEAAMSVLRRHTANTFDVVRQKYKSMYDRSVDADCRKYLGAQQLSEINHLIR